MKIQVTTLVAQHKIMETVNALCKNFVTFSQLPDGYKVSSDDK